MHSPFVSVCIITYNHELFIREAIDSVLMQQVDFELEIIIADDHSTDGTRAILESYQNKYPDRIRLLLQPQNQGPARNWLELMAMPNGK